jgi:NADP-reducing hydrogenase subunit HndB
MPTVKSLEDLNKIRADVLKKRSTNCDPSTVQIIVGMGTASIAAGARQTLQEILRCAKEQVLNDITISQTGSLGLDSWEPVVQVVMGQASPVIYGKVTPKAAERIMREHVQGFRVVGEYVIPA